MALSIQLHLSELELREAVSEYALHRGFRVRNPKNDVSFMIEADDRTQMKSVLAQATVEQIKDTTDPY